MRSKWNLITSIFQLAIGLLAIFSFFILALNGEVITKWIVTLILAIAFVILGIIGIVSYASAK